jgi:hypothetical protein
VVPRFAAHYSQQATFFAGLQVSMLSASLSDNSSTPAKLINAFWLAGTFLDVFGAILSTLTARWLEVLEPEHAEVLETAWANRANLPPRQMRWSLAGFHDWIIANALFSGLGIIAAGVTLFLLGLLLYIWTKQPLLVSILATIPVAVLTPLLAMTLLFPSGRKENVINILAARRGAW